MSPESAPPRPFLDPQLAQTLTLEDFAARWQHLGYAEETVRLDIAKTFVPEEMRTLLARAGRPRLRHLAMGATNTIAELELLGTLGEGGMGLVRLARQISLERDVAVKTLREGIEDPTAAAQLLREAGMTGLLEHPNIVPIYTLGQSENGAPLIVMKRIEGKTWSHYLAHPEELPESAHDDVMVHHLEILMQVCNAVHFAHSRGILHRDLKPDNVMIGEFGEVYVLDWGIAVSLREEHGERFPLAREVVSLAGTPVYMAPEMAAGDGPAMGVHTDVYLLGAMLYEIVTGKPPHSGKTMMQVLFAAYRGNRPTFGASVPAELVQICTTAMAADPRERFASVEALRKAIAEHLHHRASHELARTARQRLEAFTQVREIESEEQAHQVQRTYTEARFGFEQALHVWEGNEDARRGRVELIEQMIHFELGRRNHKACELLLAELEAPSEELTKAVHALVHELAGQEREFDALRLKQQDEDTSLGRGGRSLFIGLMALMALFPTVFHISAIEIIWKNAPVWR
ncbi:MAG: serine/threonine-protein kinase [Bradymonadaceae bacterium]